MAQIPIYQTHDFPGNKSRFVADPGDGRTFGDWIIGKHSACTYVPYSGFTPGNAIRVDDPADPTWTMRKAFMVPSATGVAFNVNRCWDFHTFGGGVGYTSPYSFAFMALDVCAANTRDGDHSSSGTLRTSPYFQWSLAGASGLQYSSGIDFYVGDYHQRFFQYEFAFDTWYFMEIAVKFRTTGDGFFTAKMNNVAWFDYQNATLGWAGVSTSFYPNLGGTMGCEVLEGAYQAAGSTANEREFIIFHGAAQVAKSLPACIADVPTVSLGDHSAAISGSGQLGSFTALTGATIDDAGFGGGAAAPTNTDPPTTSSSQPVVGVSISQANGTWTSSPTSYARQWQFSTDGGTVWADIAAATNTTYTPVTADVGAKLRVKVTGTNAGGSAVAFSAATSNVAASVGGTVILGHSPASGAATPRSLTSNFKTGAAFTLDAAAVLVDIRATLVGAGSAGSQAFRGGVARLSTGAIVAISSDVTLDTLAAPYDQAFIPTSTPTLTPDTYIPFVHAGVATNLCMNGYFDSGTGLLKFQSDTFSDGTSTFTPGSADGLMAVWLTLTAVSLTPANTIPPVLSGNAREGGLLSTDNGTWTNFPTAYTYQWQRSADGATGWVDIAAATAATYRSLLTDLSFYVRAQVTASNASGATTAASPETRIISNSPTRIPTARRLVGGSGRISAPSKRLQTTGGGA